MRDGFRIGRVSEPDTVECGFHLAVVWIHRITSLPNAYVQSCLTTI